MRQEPGTFVESLGAVTKRAGGTLVGRDIATGLPSRPAFEGRIPHDLAIAEAGQNPLTLLMLDIDHLDRINKRFGHPVGDIALRVLAVAMGLACRRGDFLARYGEDEFLVLAPGTTAAQGVIVAARIAETFDQLVRERGLVARDVSVSIGIADLERCHTLEPRALISAAEEALRFAKSSSRRKGGVALAPRRARRNAPRPANQHRIERRTNRIALLPEAASG